MSDLAQPAGNDAQVSVKLATGQKSGPLSGIRVLDLGRVIAAPYAAQMLADYGAEVIKIERPVTGDDARAMSAGSLLDDAGRKIPGETSMLLLANRGKRSMTLALDKPEGQEIIRRLAAEADVILENFVPGTMERFQLGYDSLRSINPKLIFCSISGWGQTGPRAGLPGFDAVLQAATGFMSVTGQREGMPGAGPVRVGASIVDIATGMNAAFAILVALRHREVTGEGQLVDVSLFDTAIAMQADNIQKFLLNGDLIGRHGSENYGGAPARIFNTSDTEIFIMAGVNQQFKALCAVLDCPELTQDPRFADVAIRFVHRDELFALLQPRILSRQSKDLLAALDAAGVPCSSVRNYREVFDDPHTHARGMAVDFQHPKSNRLRLIASPMKLSKTPARYMRPPMLGEHTDDLLRHLLSMKTSEIEALRKNGVI